MVVATPVPTHYALAKQALEAGKHVLVEKPPAMRAAEMDELVALAADADLVLMPGHLLLYHPGVVKLKELIEARRARRGAVRVRQPPEPRDRAHERERALVARRARPLGDPLPARRGPRRRDGAAARDFLTPGVEDVVFCFLRFPSGKIAHMHLSWLDPHKMRKMTVVGREKMVVFDDMELERKVTVYEKSPWKRAETYGEWQTRSGDIFIPKISTDEPLRLECAHFLELVEGRGRPCEGRARRRACRARARDADERPLAAEIHPTATVYPGTVLGDGVRVLEYAVVGKQPTLARVVDREARAAAAGADRRRHGRLDRRDRLRRVDGRRASRSSATSRASASA